MPTHPQLRPFAPPAGYVEVPSAVDGISVFAPAPEDPDKDEARAGSYRCEQCGAAVGYEVAAGAVACTFCEHVADTPVQQVGVGADQEVFTEEAIAAAASAWDLHRKELHCESCGVDLQIVPGALTASCAFCGSNQVLVREGVVSGLRPHAVLPFQIEGEPLRGTVREWLGRGWMHPKDLQEGAVLDRLVGVYVPWWTFSALVHADWQCEVGITKTRRVYKDGKWQTESYTVWEWRYGHIDVPLRDWPQLGTSKVHRGLAKKVDGYDMDGLVDYHPDVLAGWQAQAYDVGLMEAWDQGKEGMRQRVKADCRRDVGHSKVRNLSVVANFDEERWRYVLLPMHLAAYTYNGTVYHVLVNGQSGTLAGQKPVVWPRIHLVAGLLFLPGALTGLVSLPLLFVGVGFFTGILALLLLIAAGLVCVWLYRTATDAESPT